MMLTFDKTAEFLNAAVAERGADYIYPEAQKDDNPEGFTGGICRYVFRGDDTDDLTGPGCIVGHVLAQAGVPLDLMARYDVAGNGNTTPGATMMRVAKDEGFIDYGLLVENMLTDAQSAQDSGEPWGNAVERALTNNNDDF